MRVIHSSSPNFALADGLRHLKWQGLTEPSRNGNVVVSAVPVMTIHHAPADRVLVSAIRDANPFFHLFEALWMLAGRNDLLVPQTFVSTFGQYSDDGATLNGAYGYRWRNHFGYDQLQMIIDELKRNPSTRRAVLQMWDGGSAHYDDETNGDLQKAIAGSADVPCNTAVYFDTIGGKLNMTVTCRSNDVILGAYGANIVHMSVMLEYVAMMTGLPMGVYRQFSNNYHVYESQLAKDDFVAYADKVLEEDLYQTYQVYRPVPREVTWTRVPLATPGEDLGVWHGDLDGFMREIEAYRANPDGPTVWGTDERYPHSAFFRTVVQPMWDAWKMWKAKDFDGALERATQIRAGDWRIASTAFIQRRKDKANAKVR